MRVLYEDNHLLFVEKPAGCLTMGDATGDETLLELARNDVKRRHNKPGNVFLGVVHRLDRPVSGVVVFARTSKAAARLSEQFRERTVRKEYRALVSGSLPEGTQELRDHLEKDEQRNRVFVTRIATAPLAITRCRPLEHAALGRTVATLVALEPLTGRGHQLRVQLASRGWPIVGDLKYGSQVPFGGQLALHAWSLTIDHPTQHTALTVTCPLPASWSAWLGTSDGSSAPGHSL